jgi:pyrroline-5-carboxylate reductase
MKIIGIIGFGNMGSALYAGITAQQGRFTVVVAELNEDKSRSAQEEYKVKVLSSKDLAHEADIIVIAVKPQEVGALLSEINTLTKSKQIISIVAGKKIEYFSKELASDQVVRFMPNLAAANGQSAVGICPGTKVKKDFFADCLWIAKTIGTPYIIPESLMPAITGLSGSGIAYVFAFVHALALGGVSAGFKYEEALKIALTTVEGAAALLKDSGQNPIECLSRVISPAGTTIQGIKALEELGFTSAVIRAVDKAAERAKEFEA